MIQRATHFPIPGSEITVVAGTGICVRGEDLDTDLILDSDFMKRTRFTGLEQYVFDPMHEVYKAKGKVHPFYDECFAGASILFANKGFGQGSSREHAPQALMRWNIRAIIAGSYGTEIFFANCIAVGLPALTLPDADILGIMEAIEADPELKISIDVATATVMVGAQSFQGSIPDGSQKALTGGSWDAAAEMLKSKDKTFATRDNLPYRTWRDSAVAAGNSAL